MIVVIREQDIAVRTKYQMVPVKYSEFPVRIQQPPYLPFLITLVALDNVGANFSYGSIEPNLNSPHL
jgi:hypothetical protein